MTTNHKPGAPDAATVDRWRRDITFTDALCGVPLNFRTTWGVFSPEAVDEGSRMLLDLIEVNETDDCLDLGCGYGVLGLTLAKLAPKGQTLMVDKDFVAIEYAKKNIEGNNIANAQAQLSNGFSTIPADRKFDLIVCNLPAKASKEQHYLFLFDALAHLKPGGKFVVVTITGLREFMARTMKEVFGNYDKVKQGKTYTVASAFKE